MTAVPRYLLLATHVPRSGSGGGVVRYTVALAQALARRPDIELHVLATSEGAGFFRTFLPPHRVHRMPAVPTVLLSLLERLGAVPVLHTRRFDVVHGTKHIVPWVARGARRVLTVHDMLLFDRAADYPRLKRLLLRGPYRACIRQADVLVTVSRATRDRLLDYFPAARAKTRVAPLAPSQALTGSVPEPVAALQGRRFALVVGDASARKNLDLAVGTWSEVRARVPGAVLAVVGPRPWGAEDRGGAAWEALVAEDALVGLRGVSDGTLRWCYEHAELVACPSLLEGFGLPTVEAAAFGTPVVTSEDPALCEAAAGWGRPAASWSRSDWVTAVAGTLTREPAWSPSPPVPARSWDDVAADTLRAVLGGPAGDPAVEDLAVEDAAELAPFLGRTGLSPYQAPLHVVHVVSAGDELARSVADALGAAHRGRGWRVDITTDAPEPDLPSCLAADVVVLHGPAAGRLRGRLRGRVPTVLLAGPRAPRGVLGGLRERVLARWTSAVVLSGGGKRSIWEQLPVPLTRLRAADDGVDADEMAAILVRARAWGAQSPTR